MALIPIYNTPTDGGNIGMSRSDDRLVAHGNNKFSLIDLNNLHTIVLQEFVHQIE